MSHDAATMPFFADQRLARGETVAGLFNVGQSSGLGQILDEIVYLCAEDEPEEWRDAVTYFQPAN